MLEAGTPLAVAMPASTAEVAALLRVCNEAGVAVVPRGAGSGLSGGANAIDGCLVLCTNLMNRIVEVDPENLLAVVEPGVINADLRAAAAGFGLAYLPDPASAAFCSIGGNVATNAGGLCCVKYGVTRDSVLGLEVVLADGSALNTGHRTLKGVVGYDLTGLFVGSEGTLGVVTRVTVRLRPPAAAPATLVAFFPSLAAAGEAISATRRALVPSLLEIIDGFTLRAIEDWKHLGLDAAAAAMLLVQSDSGGDLARAEMALVEEKCMAAGATLVMQSNDPVEAAMLVEARRLALPALERLGSVLLDDVAVPCGRIAELLARVEEIAAAEGVVVGTFGHAGDGNMHPTLVFDPLDHESRARVNRAFAMVVEAALDLGGTASGEHGVGTLKHGFLERELGPASLAAQRAIKAALDPRGIMNPGKAV